ncbi:MAG: thiamine pyrophosphate-binding protein [Myxococcota bacterium]
MSDSKGAVWYKALAVDELPEGRVKSVTCGLRTVCLTHFQGQFAALDNRCPHQGGPLGEGSIENGLLRCPWHGWDYDPLTGKAPGFDDGVETFPIEVREDGVYVAFPAEEAHVTTTSDIMAETMVNWGVRWVFGMVGHSNLGLADALRRQTQQRGLGYVGIRHEGAASFACSAYGKLTGRPAACLAIAGPGATNLLTGLWDAHVDHAPVLALTGQVATQWLGRNNFQEIDLQAAFGGVAGFTATALHHSDHAELMSTAIKSAILNEGVSHLIFPDEVQITPATAGARAATSDGRLVSRAIRPPQDQLDAALTRIRRSKRPLIIMGHGARNDKAAITALAEALKCPVVTTFKGKGLFSDGHPLGCGVLGRSGTPIASWFMNEADLLIVLGSSFSKHTGITYKVPTVHVDRDPMALGNRHAIAAPVYGDIGATVSAITEALADGDFDGVDHTKEIADRWSIWRDEKARRLQEGGDAGIHSAALFAALTRQVPADAILAVDVGNNTYSFGRYFETRHQSVLMSGYLGSIGFALPAAMGAWAATREQGPFQGRKVISISGDGGLGQYLAEVTTLVKYDMDITHVVLNNGELGKISKEQRSGEFDVWQTTLTNPGFAVFAASCGALSVRVTDAADLDDALQKAIAHNGPALVEIMADAMLV